MQGVFLLGFEFRPGNETMMSTSLDLYRVVRGDKEALYSRERGQKITLRKVALFQARKPRATEIRGKFCLFLEIPRKISTNLKHTPPLRLASNNFISVRESNQAIFAPNCEFIGNNVFSNEIRTIMKLKIACKAQPKAEETEKHSTIMNPENGSSDIWNINSDELNLSTF